jgi:RNA polymerase sigma-70 factor (ECF subfamily)
MASPVISQRTGQDPSPAGSSRTGSSTTGSSPTSDRSSGQARSTEAGTADADRAVLVAVAGGDRTAFAALYRQFSGSVYRMVHSVIRDPAQAEEISQEVFLAIWREAHRFDPDRGTVAGYVSMLAHAKAVDRVRSAQAARRRDEKYIVKNVDRNEHHDPVLERMLLRDESVQIRIALGVLTAYQREAIELYYFDRRTYLQVAELLGVSSAAVKARVRGAVVQLRNRMVAMEQECA